MQTKMPEYSGIFCIKNDVDSFNRERKTVDFCIDVLYDDSCETGGR